MKDSEKKIFLCSIADRSFCGVSKKEEGRRKSGQQIGGSGTICTVRSGGSGVVNQTRNCSFRLRATKANTSLCSSICSRDRQNKQRTPLFISTSSFGDACPSIGRSHSPLSTSVCGLRGPPSSRRGSLMGSSVKGKFDTHSYRDDAQVS